MTRENRLYLWSTPGVIVGIFFVFKLFYPYPNMLMDSYVYLRGAVLNLGANSFPIGYSKFLQLFCFFSRSAYWLVWLQYLLLESACLLLFFTWRRFFQPSRLSSILLFGFLFCNPLFMYMSNFIMSDTLFTALSVFWVTQLIWIVCKPAPYMIVVQAVLLFLAFTIRYNALYYPVVAAVFILLSRLRVSYKIAGILLQFVFIGAFVLYTIGEMRQLTGVRQFSAFGGWQIANDALYMYGHIYREDGEPVPAEFQRLDSTVRLHFNTTHRNQSLLQYDAEGPGFYYMVSDNSPLMQYMHRNYGRDTSFEEFRIWGTMGTLYSGYGSYLIKRHPVDFFRYWAWPNTIRYFFPPTEIFSMYSPYFLRSDEIGKLAHQLFDLKTLTVSWPLINFRTSLLAYYPPFFTLLNLSFILALIGFFFFGGVRKMDKVHLYSIYSIAILWACNLIFSVTASCIVLRYQVFIMLVEFAFLLIIVDFIVREMDRAKSQNNSSKIG